ncbi:hypothetical protein F5Y07DRAFT_350636 [Xylaria sp. FL0933]|nr:hypothetical protein F5Y07DRAFT_350636 [Xylaria sp. FL0933]
MRMKRTGTGTTRIPQDLWHFSFTAGRRSYAGYRRASKQSSVAYARLVCRCEITPAGDIKDTELMAFAPGELSRLRLSVRTSARERPICTEATKRGIGGP